MTHKLYELLGVEQSSSKDDIKKAYKKLAIQMHPDKGGDPEVFKEISHAYSVLSDDDKRRQYDEFGDEGFENGGMQNINPHEIFEQLFANMGGFPFGFNVNMRPQGPQRKGSHVHDIHISLEDAYKGIHKGLKVNLSKICAKCKDTCNACQGKGHVMDMRRMGFLTQMMQRPCDVCKTSGYVAKGKSSCGECKGSGIVKTEHKIDLNIPHGVDTGHTVVFRGLGEQAISDHEISGDLVFQIQVQEHHVFKRQGNDLIVTEKIQFVDSVCGKDIRIHHFAGDINLNSSEFGIVQPGTPYIIKGKGMQGGNLLLYFDIQYPTQKLTSKARDVLRVAFTEALD